MFLNKEEFPIRSNFNSEPRINRRIRAHKLKVVADDGGFLGILSFDEAMKMAEEKELDLVEVSPNADPPVAKIMDFGKYKYEKKKHQRKNAAVNRSCLKELKVRVNIDEHDIVYKKKKMVEMLQAGHKVKVTVCYHGREIRHRELGDAVMAKMLDGVDKYGKAENPPRLEGQNLSVILTSTGLSQ